jgi:sugar-specific transcriptional regulator TrmB
MPRASVKDLGNLALFPRTMLYHVLNQLIARGLVATQDNKTKTIYIAKDPDTLYDLLHKKEQDFKNSTQEIKELIPKLKNQYILFGKIPTVRVFQGIEEYSNLLESILSEKNTQDGTILSFEVLEGKKPGQAVRENFDRRRIRQKLHKKVLFFENANSLKGLLETPYNDFTEFRSIQNNQLDEFEVDIYLFANKIIYTTYYNNHEPIALLIEDRNLYQMQANFHKMLWQLGKNRTLYYTSVNKNNI